MVILTLNGRVGLKSDPFARGFPQRNSQAGAGTTQLVGLNLWATYAGLYRTQPWLAAAVNKLKSAIARLPLKTFELGPDGSRSRTRDHPMARLMRQPNPRMSPFRFKEWLVGDVALYGNFLARAISPGPGRPATELWPVPWPQVEVIGRREPELYVFHSPLGPIPFTPDEAVHLRFWSAVEDQNPLYGTPPVEPLRRTLMNEDASQRWMTAMFSNAGRPSGIVSTENALTLKNADQVDFVRGELERLYGGVDNAFRIAVLGSNLKWQPVSMSAVDAALIELRKLNREEVAAVFDIPPPMLQILDHATFSNITEQHRILYQDTLGPWLTFIEEEFQVQLLTPAGFEDVFVEFDLSEVLKGTPKERAETYREFRRMMTINEMRERENLPRLVSPLADTIFVPINEFPISEGPPEKGSTPPLAILMSSLERAERASLSRVGAGKDSGFDSERFVRELLSDLGRDDTAGKAWAENVAGLIAAALEGIPDAERVRSTFASLRSQLQEPEAA